MSVEKTYVDNLDLDPISVPNQSFTLISVVSPSSNQKSDKIGLKIRGSFGSQEAADKHAKKLQKLDPMFDIYVVETGAWLLLPPPTDDIEQVYGEKFLNELITEHKDNQIEAKAHFEQRKMDVQRDGIDKHLLPEEKLPPPIDAKYTLDALQESVHRVEKKKMEEGEGSSKDA